MAIKKASPTVLERLRDSWQHYIHVIYMVIVISGLFFQNYLTAKDIAAKIVLIAFLVYFLALMLAIAFFIHSYSRKARYSESLRSIHETIHELRDIYAYVNKIGDGNPRLIEQSEVKHALQRALDSASTAFAIAIGANCRVAIKVLDRPCSDGKDAHVRTLARDTISTNHCQKKDRDEKNLHPVSKNTDFHSIMSNGNDYFICNDIANYPDYANTSRSFYPKKLPYSSTIVVPIRVTKQLGQDHDHEISNPCYFGFLTIDSASRHVFNIKYDVEMASAIADAVYPILSSWHSYKSVNQEKIDGK